MMDDALKKGSDARKMAITLSSLEYSGELSGQLMSFSGKMEKVFRHLRDLQDRKVTDAKLYEKFFKVLEDRFAWYTGAEAGPTVNLTAEQLGNQYVYIFEITPMIVLSGAYILMCLISVSYFDSNSYS